MPIESPIDETKRISSHLLNTFRKLQSQKRKCPGRHTTSLESLTIIFKVQADTLTDDTTNVPHQTSTSPTRPEESDKPQESTPKEHEHNP